MPASSPTAELRSYLASESDDGALLGWGGVMVVGPSAEILTIGVVPHARRQGLATDLLHALLEVARQRGARECFLEVREDNDAARAFYSREGFERLRVRRGYYANGRVHGIEMRLDLGGSPLTIVMGIETSCDETGVGFVQDGVLLGDALASSMDEHARFGGVVPEIAARAHVQAMIPTVHEALANANLEPQRPSALSP